MVHVTRVPGPQIRPPKSTSGDYPTPEHCPSMHQVLICIGKRRSGKSTAVVSLIEAMGYDYTIVVSPTMKSNKELMDRLKVEKVFEDPDDPTVVDQIKQLVQDEAHDLERYEDEMRRYHKLMKAAREGGVLVDADLLLFFDGSDFKKPEHRWNGRKPRIAVLFDDCMGSMLYSKPRKLNALSTYSRHVGQLTKGGSIGVSLFFLCQTFKAQTGGLTKVIRNQCTSMILFRTKDDSELSDVAESVSGEIDRDTFLKVYEAAIGDGSDHPFLFCDLHRKSNHPSMFRRRFDAFLVP